jgi:signal transduction histidine kinase
MAGDHRFRTPSAQRIVDLLFVAALVLASAQLALRLTALPMPLRVAPAAVVLGGLTVCWWLLRSAPAGPSAGRRVPALIMMGLACCLPFLLNSAASWPMFLVALLFFVPVWGVVAGAVAVLLLAVAQVVVFLSLSLPIGNTLVEAAASILIFGCGLGTAWLVHEHDRQRAAIAELLAEREDSFERESELMLIRDRTRAARELHDGLGHRLTLISMALQYAHEARDLQPARAWEQVDHARNQARAALEHLRRWVRTLTPRQQHGGEPLAQIAAPFRDTGMEIAMTTTGEEAQIRTELRLYEHQFVQEGLTNALRYAAGAAVTVHRRIAQEKLIIEVRDRWPAPPGESAPVEEGFGLSNLRQRAEALGGRLTVRQLDDGFKIMAELPLEDSSAVHR